LEEPCILGNKVKFISVSQNFEHQDCTPDFSVEMVLMRVEILEHSLSNHVPGFVRVMENLESYEIL